MALGLLAVFAGCDVYDQALIGGAFGPGSTGSGASAGTFTGAGRGGGSAGSAGTLTSVGGSAGVVGGTGGASGSGTGGKGGAVSNGGTGGMEGGSDGEGGEDPGVGGSAGTGGSSGAGGSAGVGGGSGGAGAGGVATGGAGTGGASGKGGTGGGAGAGAGGGGTAGGGAGGTGGAGAGGAGAGGTGGAGTGGTAGTGGMAETCTGCARLSVPLTAAGNKAHFTLLLPGTTDLSAATITFRVAKLAGTGGTFKGYIQEGGPNYLLQDGATTTIATLGSTMQNIAWSIAGAGTAANKAAIQRVGVEINGTSGAAWVNPTVLYVDSIAIAGANPAVTTYSFDTTGTVYTTPTGQGPAGQLFLNNYSGDTNVTGCAISWLGP